MLVQNSPPELIPWKQVYYVLVYSREYSVRKRLWYCDLGKTIVVKNSSNVRKITASLMAMTLNGGMPVIQYSTEI